MSDTGFCDDGRAWGGVTGAIGNTWPLGPQGCRGHWRHWGSQESTGITELLEAQRTLETLGSQESRGLKTGTGNNQVLGPVAKNDIYYSGNGWWYEHSLNRVLG